MSEYNPEVVIINKIVADKEFIDAAPALKMIAETAVVSNGITAVIVTDYNVYGKLQYICNDIGVDIMDTDFGADVTIKLAAAEEKAGILEKRITDAFSGNVVMEDKKNVKFCKKSSGEIIIL